MIKIFNPNIPLHKIKQFQEILIACNGKFTKEPFKCITCYHVHYSFERAVDSMEFNRRWRNVTEDVIEKPMRPRKRLDNLFGLLFWIR